MSLHYSIITTRDPLVDNNELMELIASSAFSNLIKDMQNILSQSLTQYEIPGSLKRSTSNMLLLLNIGIKGLEDFDKELKVPKFSLIFEFSIFLEFPIEISK